MQDFAAGLDIRLPRHYFGKYLPRLEHPCQFDNDVLLRKVVYRLVFGFVGKLSGGKGRSYIQRVIAVKIKSAGDPAFAFLQMRIFVTCAAFGRRRLADINGPTVSRDKIDWAKPFPFSIYWKRSRLAAAMPVQLIPMRGLNAF